MDLDTLYRTYKPVLLAYAYRMLGSITDAEDIVQDVFMSVRDLDWHTIEYPKAYLMKMVTNRSLNTIRSARRQREVYPGTWLPEPDIRFAAAVAADEPSEQLVLRERFGYALLVLLQQLSPLERAVYILKESLGFPYDEIAHMLQKNEAACRKLFSRASAKIGSNSRTEDDVATNQAVTAEPYVQAFAEAAQTGRFESFIRLLTDNAVLISDGGGKVRTAVNPILGRDRILAFFSGLHSKGSYNGIFHHVLISGQPGVLLVRPDGHMRAFCFSYTADHAIACIYTIMNPDKLQHIHGGNSELIDRA
ncbi:RNA polymerase sigma factor SigJ [Paenibacillus sp. CCS19]|uniref:RNA polymerase sigma factor SigJ n=1 Tax=Paenibacillus sp. CCS19 TaxID=3158387 RepID=UPI002562DBDB|nr:RNA polymerase sigma factor SigJ [Paenibacillus cellulosilyticus]GMK37838.1 RNA polymerase sigma factor SigJ [Paenibacillus cellulosilyticus]